MGRKKQKRRKPKKKGPVGNFDLLAGPGCHIARKDGTSSSWILEWEDVDPEEFEEDEVPDIAIDLEDFTLSLCNIRDDFVIAYITVYDVVLRNENGQELQAGSTTDNQGETKSATTLIILCPPLTFAHLCYIDMLDPSDDKEDDTPVMLSLEDIRIESDVQVWSRHPNPMDEHSHAIAFPLQGGPFYCTQGEGGQLTHFFAGNLHAIDFRCPIGTPLLAVGDGTIIDAKAENKLTGISVNNLFQWNSIIIELDPTENNEGPLFVEYVHIQSTCVQPGDKVTEGQVIGASGSVGFSPEPHLHFAAYRSSEPTAATVRVKFQQKEGQPYLPKAGFWYDSSGSVDAPNGRK